LVENTVSCLATSFTGIQYVSTQKGLIFKIITIVANRIYSNYVVVKIQGNLIFSIKQSHSPMNSLFSFLKDRVPYNLFQKWNKDTRNKIVEVRVERMLEDLSSSCAIGII